MAIFDPPIGKVNAILLNGKTENELSVANADTLDGMDSTDFASSIHDQPASTIELLELGTSTYDDLQDWINTTQSAGRITGGILSAHSPADGTLDISTLKGFVKVTDSDIAETRFFEFASTTISLTDDRTNYIYVDYNSGSPSAFATTDRSSINHTTQFTLGRAFRSGNDVQVLQSGINLYNRTRLTHEKWIDTFGGISYANGLLVTCTGLKPAVSAGTLYAGSNKLSLDALDCNVSDTFTAYYTTDSGSTWTTQTDQTDLNATQYNDITTGLATLNNNQYGVHWLYICPDGCLAVLYGQGSYTLTAAQALTTPPTSLPNVLNEWTKLAAKIIIAKNAPSVYSITHAWSTAFPVQSPGDHNSLAGLQGGTSNEYYHLTAAQSTNMVSGPATAISGNLPILDSTGKIISDSGYSPTDFATSGDIPTDYVNTSSYTDTAVLNKIKNVDGYNSGLDADLWRGAPPYMYYNIVNVRDFSNNATYSLNTNDTYLVIENPYGYFNGFTEGTIVRYNGTSWEVIGNMNNKIFGGT